MNINNKNAGIVSFASYSFIFIFLFFIFFHINQIAFFFISLISFIFLIFGQIFIWKKDRIFYKYLIIAIIIFIVSLLGSLNTGFSASRGFFSYFLYILPPLAGISYYYFNFNYKFLRNFLFIFTVIEIIVFSFQIIIQLTIQHGIMFGYDWAVGTNINSHTMGVIISFLVIYWFAQYLIDKQKVFLLLSLVCFILLLLTGATHVTASLLIVAFLLVIFRCNFRIKLFSLIFVIAVGFIILKAPVKLFWNFQSIISYLKLFIKNGSEYLFARNLFLKIRIFFIGFGYQLRHPYNLVFGLGLGNFNDRVSAVALIPEYNPQIRFLLNLKPSIIASDLIGKGWPMQSVINQFFSDFVSIFTELGILGVSLYFYLYNKVTNLFNKSETIFNIALFYLFYMFILGIFDNWLQYPQVASFFYILLFDWFKISKRKLILN